MIGKALLRHEDGNANNFKEDPDQAEQREEAMQDETRSGTEDQKAGDRPDAVAAPHALVKFRAIEHPVDSRDRVSEERNGVRHAHPQRIWVPDNPVEQKRENQHEKIMVKCHDL